MAQIFTPEIIELMEMLAKEVGAENGVKVVILPEDDYIYGYEGDSVSQLITPSLKESDYSESLKNKLDYEFTLGEEPDNYYTLDLIQQLAGILKGSNY